MKKKDRLLQEAIDYAPAPAKSIMQIARDEKRWAQLEISAKLSEDAVDACMLLQSKIQFVEVKFNYRTQSFIIIGCGPEFPQWISGPLPWYQAQYHEERDGDGTIKHGIKFVKAEYANDPVIAAIKQPASIKEIDPKV